MTDVNVRQIRVQHTCRGDRSESGSHELCNL